CARSPGSIVCLHSALRVHGIKSRAAPVAWLAIPRDSRSPRMPHIPLRVVRFGARARSFRVNATEIGGVPAYITSPARTVADCFRLARQAGAGAGMEALRDALGRGLVNIQELARVEAVLPCLRLRALWRGTHRKLSNKLQRNRCRRRIRHPNRKKN